MIKSERRDYQIAILGSLVIHLLLFLIYFPNGLLRQEMNLKTYPVGMVTLPKGPGGVADEIPSIETKVIEKDPPQSLTKPENQPIQPEPVKKVPETPKKNIPENSIATADAPTGDIPAAHQPSSTEKPLTPVPARSDGDVNTGPGSEDAGSGSNTSIKPRGLGSGEGKVFRMGPLPPYPKNAMNEGIQGSVGLRILVFGNGGIEKIELVNSSGDSRLDKAAQRAINSWQFHPESEAYYIDIVFAFDLKNGVSVKFIKAETRPD